MAIQSLKPEGPNKKRIETTGWRLGSEDLLRILMRSLVKMRCWFSDLKHGDRKKAQGSQGVELAYELRGQGPNLTVVNNFFITYPLWRNFTKQLVQHNRILTYDLRNQGASSPTGDKLRFSDHVQDLANLLDSQGIEKTYLLGTSTATLICRDFALAYPERVLGLILVGLVFCPFGSRRRKYMTKSWLSSLANGGPGAFFDHIYPLIYSDRTIEKGGTPTYLAMRERFLAMNNHEQMRVNLEASLTADDTPSKLRQIPCPTLVLAGDSDFVSSVTSMEGAAKLLPQGRLEILNFAGHVPYFEATAAFESSVQNFITEQEARTTSSSEGK
jgi:pimeloyl-ACP methyl ester carboxylesterase